MASGKFQVLKTANNVRQNLTFVPFFSRLHPAIPIPATRSRCMTVRSQRSGSIYSSCLWQSANNRNNSRSNQASFLINRLTKMVSVTLWNQIKMTLLHVPVYLFFLNTTTFYLNFSFVFSYFDRSALTWQRLFLNILGHQFLWIVLRKSDLV